jgi:transcriptional regulator with GAF, ATPase, and Fis domain
MKETGQDYCHDIYEIAIEINSDGTVQGTLHSVVEQVTRALNAKGCSIMLLSPNRKSLVHSISYGLSDAFIERGPRTVAKSLPETVSGGGGVAIIRDIEAESSRVQYPDAAKKEGIVSILAVPMMLKGKIIGELRVYTAERRDFSEEDIFFVRAVANLGALALDNAQLHENLEKAYRSLSTNMSTFKIW